MTKMFRFFNALANSIVCRSTVSLQKFCPQKWAACWKTFRNTVVHCTCLPVALWLCSPRQLSHRIRLLSEILSMFLFLNCNDQLCFTGLAWRRCGCIGSRASWGPRAICLDSRSFLPNTPCAQIQ